MFTRGRLLPEKANSQGYSCGFLEAIEGGGAWSAEAARAVALAANRHVALDEETLIFSDVHDLQALCAGLLARYGEERAE